MASFTPPTQATSIGRGLSLWSRYTIDVGLSVVRVGGMLILHPYPTNNELAPLTEGVDYFLGGRTYQVSDATAAELVAAGYTVGDAIPGDPGDPLGYGQGGYGEGGFGL